MDSSDNQNPPCLDDNEKHALQSANTGRVNDLRAGHTYIPGSFNVSGGLAILGDVYGSDVRNLYLAGTRAEIARAFSYHGIEARKRAISSVGKTSFDWVWSSGVASWLQDDQKLFWITGKPGSGKSTLMKHLLESSRTKQLLKNYNDQNWNMLHFFFDFTSRTNLPNTLEGMLRSLILQLAMDSPKSVTSAPEVLTQSAMIEVMVEGLNSLDKSYCIFVDALDEYEGETDEVLTLLLDIEQRTNVKMCLASRSLASIEIGLRGRSPEKLVMQDWNYQTILKHLNAVNDHVAAKVRAPCPVSIVNEIASKADGVILWASLALENILQGCSEGETAPSLRKRLEALPLQIEGVYERALSKISPNVVFEAVLYLKAIESQGSLSVRDLKALIVLGAEPLKPRFQTRSETIKVLSPQQFEYRLGALCGGLLINDHDRRALAVELSSRAFENLLDWLLPPTGYAAMDMWQPNTRFRLVHETLRTYLRTSAYLRSQSFHLTTDDEELIDQALTCFVQGKELRARWRTHAEHYLTLLILFLYLLLLEWLIAILFIGPIFLGYTQQSVEQPGHELTKTTIPCQVYDLLVIVVVIALARPKNARALWHLTSNIHTASSSSRSPDSANIDHFSYLDDDESSMDELLDDLEFLDDLIAHEKVRSMLSQLPSVKGLPQPAA